MDLMQMVADSLSQLRGTTDARVTELERQAQIMREGTAQLETLGVQSIEADRRAAALEGKAAQQKTEADYKSAKILQDIDNLFAVDPVANNSIIQERMTQYTAANKAREEVKKEYDALVQTSFLDNPIGYIINQMKLPQVAARHNALVDVRDAAVEDIATRQRLAQAQRSVTLPDLASDLRELSITSAQAAASRADATILQRQREMASDIANKRLQAFQLGDKAKDVQTSYSEMLLRYATMAEDRADRQFSRQMQRETWEATMADKQRKNDAIIAMNGRLSTAGSAMGLSPTDVPTVETLNTLGNAATQNKWLEIASTGRFGAGVVDSVENLETLGNVGALQRQSPYVFQAYQGFKAAIRSIEDSVRLQAKTNQQIAELVKKRTALNQYISELYREELIVSSTSLASDGVAKLADSRYDTLFNPYRVNHKFLLNNNQLVSPSNAMAVGMRAITTGAEAQIAGMPNVPAKMEVDVILSIVNSVKKGVLGVDDAAKDLVAYYKAGVERNLDHYNYTNFGLPAQSAYAIQVPAPGIGGDPVTFDAINFASTKAALAKLARLGNPAAIPSVLPLPGTVPQTAM